MDASMDTLVINIESATKDATSSITNLISNLKDLETTLKSVVDTSKGLSNLKNISKIANVSTKKTSIKSPKVSNDITTGITKFSAFDNLVGDNLKISQSASNLKVHYQDLNAVLKDLGTTYGDLKPIKSFISDNKNILTFKTTLGDVITLTKNSKKGFDTFNMSVKSTSPSVETLSDKLGKMQNVMNNVHVKLTALGVGLIQMAKKVVGFVEMAGAENETLNLFMVTMGDYAKEGLEWVDRFSNALYLDPVNVRQYMGSFNSLVKGLGVGAENSYLMSKNLTQLVYDLSSFKNISIESAYEKLMSGISGKIICLVRKGLRAVTYLIRWNSKHVMV